MNKYRVVTTPSQCCGVLAIGYEGEGEVIFFEGEVSHVTGEAFDSDIVILDGQYLVWRKHLIEIEELH